MRRPSAANASCSLALVALALGCDRPSAPRAGGVTSSPAADAPAPLSDASALPLDPKWVAALREASITPGSYARSLLFSWTTREQVDVLRKGGRLLLDTELPSGPTPYVELLGRTASGDGPNADLARLLLLHPSLRLRRYAWTRPWPTRLGSGAAGAVQGYGDELVRVVLAPNAVVARFDPSAAAAFELQDLDGRAVPLGEILADPSRLAAVVHVRTDPATPIAHREVVLCNEAMIAEWSVATPLVRAALDDDIALLDGLASAPPAPGPARPGWSTEPGALEGLALYASALAFDSEAYRSTGPNLQRIRDALRAAAPGGPAFSVTPSARFALDATVPRIRIRQPPVRVARVV